MTRTVVQKSVDLDAVVLDAAARLRARILAIMHGARNLSEVEQQQLASALGVRKSAVSQVFNGNGNIKIDTLGEYLAALGFEADITLVQRGELAAAQRERRAPRHIVATLADGDRDEGGSLKALMIGPPTIQIQKSQIWNGNSPSQLSSAGGRSLAAPLPSTRWDASR